MKKYGNAPMGLDIKTYVPPNVAISDGLLAFNLFLSIHFKLKDTHKGEIKNLFVAEFVSCLIVIFYVNIIITYFVLILDTYFEHPLTISV